MSALHYSARDQVSEGFRTVASARALRQPTSCRSEYFYNQHPQVPNLIGTEHSLNRSEHRVQNEASKEYRWNSKYRGISNRPGIRIMKADYFRYMESRVGGIPSGRESDYGSQMDVGSDQRSSRQ